MNTYKIVLVKKEFKKYILEYPSTLKYLLLEEKSKFDTKQLTLYFEDTHQAIEYLKKDLFLREDYIYFHGIHKLQNELTKEVITFLINQYDIEVTEKEGSYVIYNYLKQFSSNFFMFDIE